MGMLKTLGAERIRVFEFEYHKYGPWGTMDLSLIVELVDLMGYDCYWQGHWEQLWRLTGCWHARYGTYRNWSNIVCVLRNEAALHAAFESIARRYSPYVA
jgi:hypothetical protein